MLKRSAHAVWQGGLMGGDGRLTTPSKVLADARYSFPTRFGDEVGTNPEELIAAAHAGCYCMALAFILERAGLPPRTLRATAELSIANEGSRWTVTAIHLETAATIPGADRGKFEAAANAAKSGCPISRLLNAKITMDARLS